MSKSILISVRLPEELLEKLDADVKRENAEFLASHPNWTDCELSRSDVIRMVLNSYYNNYYKK